MLSCCSFFPPSLSPSLPPSLLPSFPSSCLSSFLPLSLPSPLSLPFPSSLTSFLPSLSPLLLTSCFNCLVTGHRKFKTCSLSKHTVVCQSVGAVALGTSLGLRSLRGVLVLLLPCNRCAVVVFHLLSLCSKSHFSRPGAIIGATDLWLNR